MSEVRVNISPDGKHIDIHAEYRFKEVCKRLPGATWDSKSQNWRIPLSWAGCLSLRSQFKQALVIEDDLKQWAATEKANRITPSLELRELEDYEDSDNEDLFPHQKAGVAYLATAKRALLADEPGLGKTAQAIRALKKLKDQGEDVFPAMIVCPNTLKKNWEREFKKWWPDVSVQVVKGSANKRREQLEPGLADVYVMNWESLRTHSKLLGYGSIALARCPECGGHDSKVSEARCEVHKRELNFIDFKSVVADEIHRSKDPKSKQTRALWAATGDANIRFAMTGTPIANDVVDLWPILHWISPEEFPSKTKWIDRFVDTIPNVFGGMTVLGLKPEMEAEFYASVNPRMRRMLKKKVLPWLPEVLTTRRDVEMGAKQSKAYKQMLESMITMLENEDKSDAVVASDPLVQTMRLNQFANAYAEVEITDSGKEKVTLSDPSCKVDALMEDIKGGDFGEDSVAVCGVSKQLLNLLSARLTKEGISHGMITGDQDEMERNTAVDLFQAGQLKWILFTDAAGGVGITLTTARRLVMLQRPWSLVNYKQALDRVHRIGSEQHDSILVHDYVTEGTIEERVIEALDSKAENFEEVVRDREQLKSILKGGLK